MGKLQSEFGTSANTALDNPATLKMINEKAGSFTVPDDFKGNPAEFTRRCKDGLHRLMGDEYMLAIQNEKGFDLKTALAKLPASETPTSLHYRAGVIENRVIIAGEKIDPESRLRSATMDQQRFLETSTAALREESARSGTVAADGQITDFAKQSYKAGLKPADIANYAALTAGVEIPAATIAATTALPKPKDEPKAAAPVTLAPVASPSAAAP